MTDERLDRLDALAAAATPGPWHDEGGYIKAGAAAMTTIADMRYKTGERNRPFIAACDPATIRSLVAAVRERDELRAAADAVFDAYDHTGWPAPEAMDALRAALHSKEGASTSPDDRRGRPMTASPEPTPGLREAFLERMRAPTRGERGDRLTYYGLSEEAALDIAEQYAAALAASPAPEPTGLDAAWAEAARARRAAAGSGPVALTMRPSPRGRCIVSGSHKPFQTVNQPASPEPTPGLREAAKRVDEAWDVKTNAYDLTTFVPRTTLDEMYERLRDLRRALAASPAPEPTGLDAERLADAMYEAGRMGLIYDGITNKDEAAVYAAVYNGDVEFDRLTAARLGEKP